MTSIIYFFFSGDSLDIITKFISFNKTYYFLGLQLGLDLN